ncbi:MAG: helix-turn-helix domain-containing protein [Lachnospiraceae bacterium]|nr:helix-turn-helix domain-containing protein [Lachnospiraceae bacterium]
MSEVVFGEEIRRLRLAKGWSQERLAEGICSPSTLSRIENGCQVPSRRVFRLLMEHLEGPGIFSYAYFLGTEESKREELQKDLLEAMENWEVDRVKDLLWELEQVMDYDNPKLFQFFEMSKQVCFQMCGAQPEGYAMKCFQILQIGRPNWNVGGDSEWKAMPVGMRYGRCDMVKSDYVEFWVLNNLAVGFMWQEEYEQAYSILAFLYGQLGDEEILRKRNWKMRGILSGNMALCLLHMNRPQDAREYLRRACIQVRREGGISLFIHLLHIKMDVSVALEDNESYYREQLLLSTLEQMLPQRYQKELFWSNKQWERKEFLIL